MKLPLGRDRAGLTALCLLLALAAGIGLLRAAQNVWVRGLLIEGFDDDPIGATTGNLAPPGAPAITTSMGALLGLTTHPEAAIQVVPAPGGDGSNRVLKISDATIPENDFGYSEVRCHAATAAGPGIVNASFVLQTGKYYGDSLHFSIIDNETTPGTGKVAALEINPAGKLIVAGMVTGYVIPPGGHFRFSVELIVGPGSDVWRVRVEDITGSSGVFQSAYIPTMSDVNSVRSMVFRTSDQGMGTYYLDDLRIDLYAPGN